MTILKRKITHLVKRKTAVMIKKAIIKRIASMATNMAISTQINMITNMGISMTAIRKMIIKSMIMTTKTNATRMTVEALLKLGTKEPGL